MKNKFMPGFLAPTMVVGEALGAVLGMIRDGGDRGTAGGKGRRIS
jgi:hypothetical protein